VTAAFRITLMTRIGTNLDHGGTEKSKNLTADERGSTRIRNQKRQVFTVETQSRRKNEEQLTTLSLLTIFVNG